jgi:hypothetical protein
MHTLWIGHAHLMDAWESTPRIAFLSPEPASGKTRALEITELLVPNPVLAANVTPSFLLRKMGDLDVPPTILFDEVDAIFGPKAKPAEEIRAAINAGHRRGAITGRTKVVGKTFIPEEISSYCAVAMAGLGGLPDTIISRSIVVPMRRRAADETVEPYRRRVHAARGEELREMLAGWAAAKIREARDGNPPALPDGIEDRDADLMEPLLTVADLAGRDWPTRARVAAVALVALSKEMTPSLGIRLLADLRTVFSTNDCMSTVSILAGLQGLDESPWIDLQGKPLNARRLGNLLGRYGVRSKTVRPNKESSETPKGYTRTDLHDVWVRYLKKSPAPTISLDAATSATPATIEPDTGDAWEH